MAGRLPIGRDSRWAAATLVCAACAACAGAGLSTAPPGSTLERTLVDRDANGVLEPGPGAPLIDRTDLAPAGRVARTLATIVQISDAHVTDEESPLRVEAVDRLGAPLTSAFRPQESLTTQVLAAMLTTVRAIAPTALVVSGDLIDNGQRNELALALAALHGGAVAPDSGAPGYDGLQRATSSDPFIYRPDVDAPRHPGLLDEAQQEFSSPGAGAPILPLISNHDILVQGNEPVSTTLDAIATGSVKLATPSTEIVRELRDGELTPADAERRFLGGQLGETIAVPADPARALLSPDAAVATIAAATGVPTAGGRLAYDRPIAPGIRLVALDTARRDGGAGGLLPADELAWLGRELALHPRDRWLIVSPTPLEETIGGQDALALLDRSPGVLAVLAGDTHRALIRPRTSSGDGYWLIRCPSLIDYPQQARALRVVELADGRVAIETWLLDHAGHADGRGFLRLAGISRDLAYLDVQGGRVRGFAGTASDRNARLFLAH